MFVRYYVTIPAPFAECREALLREPQAWLPQVVAAAQSHSSAGAILARMGFSILTLDIRKQVAITVGQAAVIGDWLHVPVEWRGSPTAGLFPEFKGEIQLVPIDPAVTKLAVAGSYCPPAGVAGRALDNLLLHTAAEATLKDFTEGVARQIGRVGIST